MLNSQYENTVSRLLYIGVPATSLFLITSAVTDPVNATKFFFLGGVGFSALLLVLTRGLSFVWNAHKVAVIFTGLFVLFSISSVVQSNSPLSQNLYGVYGRNTGFLTYFFLCGIFLSALGLSRINSYNRIFLGLFFTGVANVLYCGWVVFFGEIISWSNPYGNILGFFGNPNFIGAFLGIWISATTGYFLFSNMSTTKKLALLALLLLAIYEVYKSRAVQGVVVTAAGLAVVLFFVIRSKAKSDIPTFIYSILVIIAGTGAGLGALQKGPLAEVVYKTSVSLRGAYWHAGLEMGLRFPFSGVGMDAYGDWYRRSRSVYSATVLPGPNTVSNSAHNVVIDIFAYGGFPLLISYLGILILGFSAIVKGIRSSRSYDPVFVAIVVAWSGYQLQSIISINQVGLVVWGWLLTGLLISYVRVRQSAANISTSDKPSVNHRATRTSKNGQFISSPLIAGIGIGVGLVLSAPPISADMAWTKSTRSGNFLEVQKALTPSYLHPSDSNRLVQFVGILEQNNLSDQAREYALKAVKFNPDNVDSWFALYSVRNSSQSEKDLALKNMRKLDPNNPNYLAR
jgi:O-antigen ligase